MYPNAICNIDELRVKATTQVLQDYGVPEEFTFIGGDQERIWESTYRGHKIQIHKVGVQEEHEHPRNQTEILGTMVFWDDKYKLGDEQPHYSREDHFRTVVLNEHVDPDDHYFDNDIHYQKSFVEWQFKSCNVIMIPVYQWNIGDNEICLSHSPAHKGWQEAKGYHWTSYRKAEGWFNPKLPLQSELPLNDIVPLTTRLTKEEVVWETLTELAFELKQYDCWLRDDIYKFLVWAPGNTAAVMNQAGNIGLRKKGINYIYRAIDKRIKDSICP